MSKSIINVAGVSDNRVAPIAAEYINDSINSLIIVSSNLRAKRLEEDLAFFVEKEVIVLPEIEETLITYDAKDRNFLLKQMTALTSLSTDKSVIVIAPVKSAIKRLPPKKRFLEHLIEFNLGDEININELTEKLTGMGYERVKQISVKGEYSIRGEIIDIFSPDLEKPIRLDLFDTEIDSIKLFDVTTQRTTENISKVLLCPIMHIMPSDEEIEKVLLKLKKQYDKQIKKVDESSNLSATFERLEETIKNKTNPQIYEDYVDYFHEETTYIWDYLNEGKILIEDPNRIKEVLSLKKQEDTIDFETLLERGQIIPSDLERLSSDKDYLKLYDNSSVIFTPFPERIYGDPKLTNIRNINSHQMMTFVGNMDIFGKEVKKYLKNRYQVNIVATDKNKLTEIQNYLLDNDISGNIVYVVGTLKNGMEFPEKKICYICENDIFQTHRKKKTLRKKNKDPKMNLFSDMSKGDYVVHENHGVGKFMGIHSLTIDNEIKDYLKIKYAGTDTLYIPTEQMDIIQKYVGAEGFAPKLSRLSGNEWQKTKSKAKTEIMDIAEDLIKLYAERQLKGGYSFSEDSVWQKEFEDSFPFNETEDQLRASEEIKEDMVKEMAMDRLLCGDVGYGKTEVAARAIFKCLDEGKQAVLLAPTTILVNQHYYSLKERFEKFPFKVEMLSRFRNKAEQEEIIEKLKKGDLDLVIGTHRLVSNDVKFKDLGLLVIDEEQRFGVKHKEKIKELKANVDVLTLSATPIPRTLNMSLTGIRDMSVLEEPPEDRYPVQTYVTAYEENLLKDVIEREINRGGQVFVVYNRVKDIDRIAKKIQELVPYAQVVVGHGQMNENALENIMMDFVEGKKDVLVATTIVESGIDIPNANTMIILNADKFGLSQLYQLRGRVGRSNRIAYAYLMYQRDKVLTEVAEKRLRAIREFTEFGAGFKIAMRDMELRGAGNVLGSAQSGHMTSLGYELYCKEVDRAVKLLRGEISDEVKTDITVDIKVPANIPAVYIEDETLRLQMYKKIAQINSSSDRWDLIDEIVDRFGEMPKEVMNLIGVSLVRALAEKLAIQEITEKRGETVINFGEKNILNGFSLFNANEKFGRDLFIHAGKKPMLKLKCEDKEKVGRLVELLEILNDNKSS
ncbi:MAG: transcription-repair coupling factor [Peptostreptococcaceae bacterium]|nr:transcription-repair coupling factor [Peptostreptococcaceae bacterium]